MSVTTTSNARILTTANYLADYDLHHSQPSATEASPAPAPNSQQQQHPSSSSANTTNPPNWETSWRRVPSYRPAVDQRDEQHETYNNEIERNFVRVMFGGVFMMASASQIWRATGGRFNGEFFKYKIGGEW